MRVGVMPFVGDDPALIERLRGETARIVGEMEGYTSEELSGEAYAKALATPDEPPVSTDYAMEMPYALTGAHFPDYPENDRVGAFQIWLWDTAAGRLIFTDELTADDREEAESYLPNLINWLFANVMPPAKVEVPVEVVAEPEPEPVPLVPWLYLGMRAGGAFNTYNVRLTDKYDSSTSQAFGAEAALALEIRPWRFFGFQVEAIGGMDLFNAFAKIPASSEEILHKTEQHTAYSLLLSLQLKVPLEMESSRLFLSLVAGAYYVMPLGWVVLEEITSRSHEPDLPIGVIGGADIGGGVGPGNLFVALRFGRDLGITGGKSEGLQYVMSRMSISIGYHFEVLKKKKYKPAKVVEPADKVEPVKEAAPADAVESTGGGEVLLETGAESGPVTGE
jgi:hypothetical protein